jgi:hypothetical protein
MAITAVQRKVGKFDALTVKRIAVAILDHKVRAVAFGIALKFPDLEFFRMHCLIDRLDVAVGERNFVDQPIGTRPLGEIFDAIGIT